MQDQFTQNSKEPLGTSLSDHTGPFSAKSPDDPFQPSHEEAVALDFSNEQFE